MIGYILAKNDEIVIKGARHHNLKNVNLTLPKNKLVVITGVSGSGKSTLAYDTLYAEGQRRYVESLSTYARQYLKQMQKPEVDLIEGLAPAISIKQKSSTPSPRSTVGTITEIHDYLRLLFSRAGQPHCPDHKNPLSIQTIAEIVNKILTDYAGQRILIAAPIHKTIIDSNASLIDEIGPKGFVRARINNKLYEIDSGHCPTKIDTLEIIVDRLTSSTVNRQRLADSVETASTTGDGRLAIFDTEGKTLTNFSTVFVCPDCSYKPPTLTPKLFSFNNPSGACENCKGIGISTFFDPNKVVGVPDLSLAAGAIDGWDRRNEFYQRLLMDLASHYQFDLNTPFKNLPEDVKNILLYGSKDEPVRFSYLNKNGKLQYELKPFEGIIPNFESKWIETDSNIIKNKLEKFQSETTCPECLGTRLRKESRNVFIKGTTIDEICALTLREAFEFFNETGKSNMNQKVAGHLVSEIKKRLLLLINVGVDYLSLNRPAATISGGEHQRIRLASQIGSGLTGVLYILDEPSIGLHERDNERLLKTLKHLRDSGNSVLVVEHDLRTIKNSDYIIDMGPGAGENGGEIIASGTPIEISKNRKSITGQYLAKTKSIRGPKKKLTPNWQKHIQILNARGNNLKGITVEIPLGLIVCVTGVSGSGKSTLINQTLYKFLQQHFHKSNVTPATCDGISGLEHLDKVVAIDQRPIGRTPRSNPASYVGLYGPIREIFSNTPLAREKGYSNGRFSFNVKGGRCENCQGAGIKKVEMHFLPDVHVACDLCNGKRFNEETLEVKYKGKNIDEVLNMTVDLALLFFKAIPEVHRKLLALSQVGLGYLKIGHSAVDLSGGEAQRVKLGAELSKKSSGRTIYILDEPTTGLHLEDISNLLGVLEELRDAGNTVVIVEHNLEVIKTADWIIDLGPEGGEKGGEINALGSPIDVALDSKSHTGLYLRRLFEDQG